MVEKYLDANKNPPKEGLYTYNNSILCTLSISFEKGAWYVRDGDDVPHRLAKQIFARCEPLDEETARTRAQTFEKKAKFIRSELEILAQSQQPRKKGKWKDILNKIRYSSGPGDNVYVYG